jgi:hypothetical protein
VEEILLSAIKCSWVNSVRQAEIYSPEPNSVAFEVTVEKLEGANHQVMIKLHMGGKMSWSEVHKHINSIWSKAES